MTLKLILVNRGRGRSKKNTLASGLSRLMIRQCWIATSRFDPSVGGIYSPHLQATLEILKYFLAGVSYIACCFYVSLLSCRSRLVCWLPIPVTMNLYIRFFPPDVDVVVYRNYYVPPVI